MTDLSAERENKAKNLLLCALQNQKNGNLKLAIENCRHAIEIYPQSADIHFNLAHFLNQAKQLDEAIIHFKESLTLKPNPLTHANLSIALHHKGKLEECIPHYLSALNFSPNNIDLLSNLGSAYRFLNLHEKAHDIYQHALKIDPKNQRIIHNLANLLKDYCMLDEALDHYKKALMLAPNNPLIYNSILLSAVYAPSVILEEPYNIAREFDTKIASPLKSGSTIPIDLNSERKLRIGYLSPDFRDHPVNYFLEHLIANHDREKFEIFAYSNVMKEDVITERLKNEFDHWRDIRARTDDDAADLIRADKIDILIDLAGHTADNRLLVFARKPAPIQATWLGYPATTGLKAIDYRITDSYCEPEGMTEHLNIEKLWRLPQIFCCYGGHESSSSIIDHPPYEDNGHITFGCFNSFVKVSDKTLATWADILNRVPNSQLLLEISGLTWTKFKEKLEERLEQAGLPRARIILEPRKKSNQFVLYNKIDIALDPFPCNGGTTSMDTLWMGVPFITLAGKHFVSRMGVSILSNAGLPELIARNEDEYIEKAVSLANDRERLKSIRHNLRQKVEASPVMDQKLFARNFEDALRNMWVIYCSQNLAH